MAESDTTPDEAWKVIVNLLLNLIVILIIFSLTSCVQPVEPDQAEAIQKECLAENRCWRITKAMFFDVTGMACGEKLKYPVENYWHNSDFDIGVNCNENDSPRIR